MRDRPAARLIVVDSDQRVLLFQFVFDDGALAGQIYWATPGGAVQGRETFADAARRELLEETGIVAQVGVEVARRHPVFQLPTGDWVRADERYFLVRVSQTAIRVDGQDPYEVAFMKTWRWWPIADLRTTSETVFPEDFADLVEPLVAPLIGI